MWDEIGLLQFEFLRANGLSPDDHLLDIGCGSLRGGVHFAAYLEPGHYWGIDANASQLEAGYAIELAKLGLTTRVPRSNLLHEGEFDLARFGQTFDAAIAQSLFTHLSQNRIRLCLLRLAKVMRPGGRFFATYFESPESHPFEDSFLHPNGVRTFGHKNPFHYRLSDMEAIVGDLPWHVVWAGDWDHPRNQKMMILERLPDAAAGETAPDSAVRQADARGSFAPVRRSPLSRVRRSAGPLRLPRRQSVRPVVRSGPAR